MYARAHHVPLSVSVNPLPLAFRLLLTSSLYLTRSIRCSVSVQTFDASAARFAGDSIPQPMSSATVSPINEWATVTSSLDRS